MHLITLTKQLKKFLKSLEQDKFVAIDTEFNRTKTYYPELALIQIAGEFTSAIIDPLSNNLSLAPLFEFLANPEIIKVFFAARQDVEIIFQHSSLIPANIFDCQIAAQFCGYDNNISYRDIVEKLTGILIDKSFQYTDWLKRPLSQQQMNYAISDVTHLRVVYKKLIEDLENRDRLDWVKQECLSLQEKEIYEIPKDQIWKKVKLNPKSNLEFHLLYELSCWREETAKHNNLPRGWICSDDLLRKIIQQKPRNKQQLEKIIKASKREKNLNDYFQFSILKITNKIYKLNSSCLRNIPGSFSESSSKRQLKQLQELLQFITNKELVSGSMIANTAILKNFLYQWKCDRKNLKNNVIMQGWRFEIFGKKAYNLLQNLENPDRYSDMADLNIYKMKKTTLDKEIVIEDDHFMCAGALAPFDHPHVYLTFNNSEKKICPYCGITYIRYMI